MRVWSVAGRANLRSVLMGDEGVVEGTLVLVMDIEIGVTGKAH